MDNKDKNKFIDQFATNLSFKELTNRIAEYLYQYSFRTGVYFNRDSPKLFGNCAFWLDDKDGTLVLMYNLHPKHWKVPIIISQFEQEEKRFLEQFYQGYGSGFMQ